MEAQSLLPRCCPSSTIRYNHNSRNASSYLGCRAFSGRQSRAHKHLSLQPHSFASSHLSVQPHSFAHSYRARSNNRLECRNSNTKLAGDAITGDEPNIETTPRVTRKRLALFVSGGGSNFRSIHEASLRGSIHGDVVVLVTNNRGCGGATYAADNGIPVILFPSSKDEPEGLSPADLVISLRRFNVDFILLAGYLKLIPAELIRSYPQSILNIHPSLLPSFGGKGFYGMKVHKAVISSGARYSGPTIHFVDEHFDTGRILAQRVVPVLANDTADDLAARVLHEEHNLYVEVTSALCEERIIWRGDGVPLIRSRENPNKFS